MCDGVLNKPQIKGETKLPSAVRGKMWKSIKYGAVYIGGIVSGRNSVAYQAVPS